MLLEPAGRMAGAVSFIPRYKRLPKVAKRRGGLDRLERLQMDDLCRAVVMVRARAGYDMGPNALLWFGWCEECSPPAMRHPDPVPLDWSHILGRAEAPRLVWVPENAIAHCRGCHYTWGLRPSLRADRLAVILARRVPCAFAPTVPDYKARLFDLARLTVKADHSANRVALAQWLKREAPSVLVDLADVWQRRAEKR